MKNLLFASFIMIFTFGFGQSTPIPDPNFETQLIAFGYDTNGLTGDILNTDAEAVTEFISNGDNITNFDGLQAFKNIRILNLGRNQFTTLPLDNLTNLEELSFKDNVVLASLDLTKNINLKKLDIRSIQALNTSSIATLNLSANIRLEYIHIFNFQDLETILFPQTKSLTYLTVYSNFDLVGDTSFYDNLETLDLGVLNGKIITLTLPTVKTKLKSIRIANGNVTDFRSLALFVNLEEIRLYTITEFIEFPESNTVTYIHIGPHSISNPVSFQGMPSLNYLEFVGNRTKTPLEIDISSNSELETLILSANKMVNLDLEGNPKLVELKVQENNMEGLGLSKNPKLKRVWAYKNLLSNIDLRNNQELVELRLNENRLKSLDLTENKLLVDFNISKNLFVGEGPDITQNTELVNVNMSNNKISSLDITECLKLVNVDFSFNTFSGNNILEQIVQNYQTSGRSLGQEIYALNDNLLSNEMPDFTSLVSASTNNFSLSIENNSFHFGDLEARHQQYVDYTNTMQGGGNIFRKYSYAGQSKVNIREVITTVAGEPITLATVVRGSQNHYKWFKDGVEIIGAADAPEYLIPAPEACESGVYYAEITSDLMPFEDASSPGTDGKNLVLQRNDLVLGANGIPSCAILINPLNKSVDIPINAGIEWESESGACGFLLSVGSLPGATDILDAVDVGNVSGYNFENYLPVNTEVFVTITPYFESGPLLGCREESFTTNSESTLPECSVLTQPLTGSVGVNGDTNINWSVASGAEGYRVKVGTTSGASDLANVNIDDGSTIYDSPIDFLLDSEIFVTITPYNSEGDAIGCAESSFVVSEADEIPPCTSLSRPLNGDIDVKANTLIRWNRVGNATGYVLNMGTTEFGSDLLSRDVGSKIEFQLESNLPDDETIYVTIVPYNTIGTPVACQSESFVTAALKPLPECSILIAPINGERNVDPQVDLAWDVSEYAEGYFLEVGTTPDGDEVISLDVGLTTFYNFRTDLPEGRPIYVKIMPYNERGEAVGCLAESFTTSIPAIPSCSSLAMPLNGDVDVSVATNFAWNTSSTAKGYKLKLGLVSGGSSIFSEDLGATTFFDLPDVLPSNTIIYATVIPYNDKGEALDCQEEIFTTSQELTLPDCSVLNMPINGDTAVSVTTNIAWSAIQNAKGYRLNIGSSNGISDIFSGDVGPSNSINLSDDLPENSTIYVSITPYNDLGEAQICSEETFATAAQPSIPNCVNLSMPAISSTDVSISTNFAWPSISNADGYLLSIGTFSGGADILTEDIGLTNFYDLTQDLPFSTDIFVSILPYNDLGMAMGCMENSFTTGAGTTIPSCTSLRVPMNNEVQVSTLTNIAWYLIDNAQGYTLNLGTSLGGTDIFSGDVGKTTWYDLENELPENTEVFVTIVAYNELGESENCISESFITAGAPTVPSCSILVQPFDGTRAVDPNTMISWSEVSNADGYSFSVGTEPGGADIVDSQDVGLLTEFILDGSLPSATQIYVTIAPYNAYGENLECGSQSFVTATSLTNSFVPFCTAVFEPIDGQSNVATTTIISWNEVTNADGYLITLGTDIDQGDILDNFDVGLDTSYLAEELPVGAIIYVSVSPYNEEGSPEGCKQFKFLTSFEEEQTDDTMYGFSPNGDGINDFWVIDGIEFHPDNIVTIYNRWGDAIFQTNGYDNYTNVFDGMANQKTKTGGGRLPAGTYFFNIKINGEHNLKKTKGYLVLKK